MCLLCSESLAAFNVIVSLFLRFYFGFSLFAEETYSL